MKAFDDTNREEGLYITLHLYKSKTTDLVFSKMTAKGKFLHMGKDENQEKTFVIRTLQGSPTLTSSDVAGVYYVPLSRVVKGWIDSRTYDYEEPIFRLMINGKFELVKKFEEKDKKEV